MATATTKKVLQGGEFLIRESGPQDIFIPEEINEEQRMIAQTCSEFLQQEVWPILDRIDAQLAVLPIATLLLSLVLPS